MFLRKKRAHQSVLYHFFNMIIIFRKSTWINIRVNNHILCIHYNFNNYIDFTSNKGPEYWKTFRKIQGKDLLFGYPNKADEHKNPAICRF